MGRFASSCFPEGAQGRGESDTFSQKTQIRSVIKRGEKEQKLSWILEGFFPSHVKNHQVLARLCFFPPRTGGPRAGGSLLELWDVPREKLDIPEQGCSRHHLSPAGQGSAWELLPSEGQAGSCRCRKLDHAGEPPPKPNTKTWKPKTNVGCGLLSPDETDLESLRAREMQNKPNSTAWSRKSPLGNDVPTLGGLGGLKPLVPMGTLTLALAPSAARPGPRQWDRFPPARFWQAAPLRGRRRVGSVLPREGFGWLLPGDAAEEKERFPACLPVPATAQQGQPTVWHGTCSS